MAVTRSGENLLPKFREIGLLEWEEWERDGNPSLQNQTNPTFPLEGKQEREVNQLLHFTFEHLYFQRNSFEDDANIKLPFLAPQVP